MDEGMGRKDGHDYTGKVRDPIIQPNGKDTLFSGRAVSPPSILVRTRARSREHPFSAEKRLFEVR
jgi:hypothetical protein